MLNEAPIAHNTLPSSAVRRTAIKGSFVSSHRNSRILALSAACVMLGFDQLTKQWALAVFAARGTTIQLAGPIDLTLVLNRSNAFGLIPSRSTSPAIP
jgi:lipoprotein signal peptidase